MIQAAATRVIDFKDAKPFDRMWDVKLDLLLGYVARTNLQHIYASKLAQHLAVLSYESDSQAFEHHWEQATQIQNNIVETTLPWLTTRTQDTKEIAEQLTQEYTGAFGDPNSPEFQEEADRLIEYWRSTRQSKDTR